METMYYIGLDVHKKTIDYCVKDGSGRIYAAGSIRATRLELDMWMKTLPQPWTVAMEATIFTAWIYDHLQPHAAAVKVAHPLIRNTLKCSLPRCTGLVLARCNESPNFFCGEKSADVVTLLFPVLPPASPLKLAHFLIAAIGRFFIMDARNFLEYGLPPLLLN